MPLHDGTRVNPNMLPNLQTNWLSNVGVAFNRLDGPADIDVPVEEPYMTNYAERRADLG